MFAGQRHRFAPLLPVLSAWLLVSLPSLWMGIHADDWFQLRPRPVAEVLAAFAGDWNSGERLATGFYRPLSRVSFALDTELWGLWAPGLHMTNALLFLAVLLAIYRCALVLTEGKRLTSAVAASLVAVHPAKNEALYWLSGRTDLLAAAFALWGVWCALRALERGSHLHAIAAPALVFLGLLAKEVAAAGFLIVPLAVWLLRPAGARRGVAAILCAGSAAALVAYAMLRAHAIGGVGGYYASRAEPLAAGEVAGNILGMVGAVGFGLVAAGWVVPGAAWLAAVVGLVALSGAPRPIVWCLGAMLLALAPMGGLALGDGDGGRVLTLALGFWAMGLAVVGARVLPRACAKAIVEGLAFLLLAVWAIATLFAAGEWAGAAEPNERALAEAERLSARGPVILPDPPHWEGSGPHTGIRILQPGVAAFLAMQTRWLHAHGDGATAEIRDLCLEMQSATERRIAYPFPIPTMEEGTQLVEFRSTGGAAAVPLGTPMRWAWSLEPPQATLRPIPIAEPGKLLFEADGAIPAGIVVAEVLDAGREAVALLGTLDGAQGTRPGAFIPVSAPDGSPRRRILWMRNQSADARRFLLESSPPAADFTLLRVSVAAYPLNSPTDSQKPE